MKTKVYDGLGFFPSDPVVLDDSIKKIYDFVKKDKKININKPIKAGLSPHAGYQYSGLIAGYTYFYIKEQLEKNIIDPQYIFIISPSHFVAGNHFFYTSYERLEVPTGFLRVKYLDIFKKPIFMQNDNAFEKEHSLFTQLPFIVDIIGEKNIPIVPIITGQVGLLDVETLANILKPFVEHNLFIISSDLSHFLGYDQALFIDEQTLLQIQAREFLVEENQACGSVGINVFIQISKMLNLDTRLIKYANSGMITGDKHSVVGYASLVWF